MVLILVYDSSRFKPVKSLKIYLCRVVWFFLFFPCLSFVFTLESLCNYILQRTSNDGQDGFRKEDKPKIEMNVCVGAGASQERGAVFGGIEASPNSGSLCLIVPQVAKVSHF